MKIQSSQNLSEIASFNSKKELKTTPDSRFKNVLEEKGSASLKEFSPTVYASIEVDIPKIFAKRFS